jgi:hypothetical protein
MRVSHPNDAYESVHRQFAWHVPVAFQHGRGLLQPLGAL